MASIFSILSKYSEFGQTGDMLYRKRDGEKK